MLCLPAIYVESQIGLKNQETHVSVCIMSFVCFEKPFLEWDLKEIYMIVIHVPLCNGIRNSSLLI